MSGFAFLPLDGARFLRRGFSCLTGGWRKNTRLLSTVLSVLKLSGIQSVVLLLKLTHLFDLIKIYNIASFKIVQILNAFTTENRRMFTAIEMLDSLFMCLTEIRFKLS